MTAGRLHRGLRTAVLALSLGLAGCSSGWFGSPEKPKDSPELSSLLRLGAAAETAGDVGNAVSVYQRAQALYPEQSEPSRRLGDLYRSRGLYDLATRSYTAAVAADPDDREARLGLAAALVRQGKFDAAAGNYDTLLERDARDIRAWNGKAVVLDLRGDHAGAWEAFHKGLEVAPDNLALRTNLGLSLAFGGRVDEGIEILERAAADPKAGPETRQNLALAYGLAGRTQDAARLGQKDLKASDVVQNLDVYDLMRATEPKPAN